MERFTDAEWAFLGLSERRITGASVRQRHKRSQRWEGIPARSIKHPERVAIAMLVIFVAAQVAAALLGSANSTFSAESSSLLLGFAAFMVVGALIVAHRPDNAVGWIFSSIGLLSAAGGFAQEYAAYSFVTRPGSLPLPTLAAWLTTWFWFPLLAGILVFSILFFPTGRLLSRRWRGVAWTAGIGTATISLLASLKSTIKLQDHDFTLTNPIGVEWIGDVEKTFVGSTLFIVLLATMASAFTSLGLRFRRARGEERQQLKLVTFASVLVVASVIIDETVTFLELHDFFFGLVVALVPISAGVAILRYRLYDIDRIISRTLAYGALTAILGGGYLLAVLGLQSVLPVPEDSPLIVAVSTLAVVAAFGPLRTRIQHFVDRRFNRSRYDAEHTIAEFAGRLRSEVELDALTLDLVAVVENTVQPAHVSVWLRSERAPERDGGAIG